MNLFRLMIGEVLWHSPEDNIRRNAQDIELRSFEITNSRLQLHLPGANELTQHICETASGWDNVEVHEKGQLIKPLAMSYGWIGLHLFNGHTVSWNECSVASRGGDLPPF